MSEPRESSNRKETMASDEPSVEEVRAQLKRILDSPALQGSPRRRELLHYLVEETLAGHADQMKGYTIALAVFGRAESFDPAADPVVRLEAGRLRRSLDTYYANSGKRDTLRISIPKGAYVAHFEVLPGVEPTAPGSVPALEAKRPRLAQWISALAAVALLGVAAMSWFWLRSDVLDTADTKGPAIIVLPFKALGSDEEVRYLADGITQELITNLMRFPSFRLFSISASFGQGITDNPMDVGHSLGASYVVEGSVRSEAAAIRISATVIDTSSGQVLWSETYDRDLAVDAVLQLQVELAASIASTLGQPYGIVRNDLMEHLEKGSAPNMSGYDCVLRAYAYRRTFSSELYAPVLACLETAVRRDPDYADAWAMLGWLQLDDYRFNQPSDVDAETVLTSALDAATHAVEIAPTSVLSLQALAAINHYLGRYDESERIQRQALALNPNDPDTLAQLGWRLVVRGRYEEGAGYVQRAIDRSVKPPSWYFDTIAVERYMRGDYPGMLIAAKHSGASGSAMGQSYIAIAQGALGNLHAAEQALAKMAELYPPLARDPAAVYLIHRPTEPILTALVDGLHTAGFTSP